MIQLLRLLSRKELDRFQQFLNSTFSSQPSAPQQLFTQLKPYHPHFAHPAFRPEKIWADCFPKKPFHQQTLKDQMSQLSRLVKQFLALTDQADQFFEEEVALLKSLAKRRAEKLFIQHRKAVLKSLESQPRRDLAYYERKLAIAETTALLKGMEWTREYDPALQERANHLNLCFLLRKLQDFCEMLNRNYLQQEHYQLTLLDEVKAILNHHPALLEIPVVQLWHLALYTLLPDPSSAILPALLAALEKNGHLVQKSECRALYKYALNYCIRRINAGETEYLQNSFSIYREMLGQGLLFVEGKLSHTDYKNIASAGIRLGEFDWVQGFIVEYKKQVDPAFAENVFTYCLAHLYAESGKARDAIRLMQSVQFTDVYYALSARTLLLRIYFEQTDPDDLSYQIKAYQHFLRRNQTVSQRNRKLYLQFSRYFQRLVRMRERRSYWETERYQAAYQKLWTQLRAQTELAHKSWLSEKLEELRLA